jgi:hypothetical protein
MQETLRTPLFNQNPKKIEKQKEQEVHTVKETKKVATEQDTKERVEVAKGEHEREEVRKRIEPILRKAWPDIETITVYELEKNTKNLDFAGCDAMIRFKDGSVIHAAFRENDGGPDNWYTFASMERRSSVKKYEGKAMQSVEIQTFKQNKQLHILDSDEVYKFAYEFQKNRKPNTLDLIRRAREKGIDKDEFLDNAHQITFDKKYASTPEKEDAIRIKYKGYNNLNECRVVEVLHKWEKYNFEGKLIEKGSHGVDRHAEHYKEKTKALEAKFPVETRLAYEKEAQQKKKELFAIHKDPESDKDSGGRLFGGSKNTNSEKGANRMNTHVEEKSIQKLEVDCMKDFEVGYDSKAGEFCMYESRNGNVHVREEYIDDFKDKVKEKITQLLEYGTDNDELACKFEEIKELQRDDFTGNYNLIKNLKDQIGEFVDGILDTVNFERLEMAPLEIASIKKDTEKMKEEAEKQMPDPGDSKDLAPAGSSLRGRKGAEK